MEVFRNEQQLCRCYEESREFQKLGELKVSGLVVYCHRPRAEDIRQAEAAESAVTTSRDVFILYNKKNVIIKTSELTLDLEKENISCPRCRKTFEHAQELMQEVKSIDKKMVLGICDHCRKKAQRSKKPFCVCDKIVKKFISVKELPRPSLKDRKQGEIFEDRPSMDAKEALKRRHDLSLRQMMRLEKDSGDPYYGSKRPDIYETPKIVPWTQKEPTSKYYLESEMDNMKLISTLKHDRDPRGPRGPRGTPDLDYVSNRDVKFRSTKASQDSFIAPKEADRYHHDKIKQGLSDSEERQKKLEQAQKKKLVREEKVLQAEERKKQPIEDQKKYEEEQRKLKEEQKKKLAEQKYSEKEHKVKGKISKEPLVATKHVMPETYHRGVSEKNKKGIIRLSQVKPEKKGADEGTEKRSKDLTPEKQQKEKNNKVSEKADTEFKQKDKGMAKEQKRKPEKEDRDEKLQREKTDKENLKKRKAQASKELDALSKKEKASKKTRDAFDAAVVSISKIQKSLKNEKSGKQETPIVKLGKEKESEAKKKETADISEIEKLKADYLKEKKKKEQLKYEEAEHKRIKMLKEQSDANLALVILKQAAKMSPSIQKCNHQRSEEKSSLCQFCANSNLELELLSLDNKKNLTTDKTDIIIGEKIFKYKPRLEKIQEPEDVPILFQKEFCVEHEQLKDIEQIIPQETIPEQEKNKLTKTEMEGEGVIRYALSDRNFITKDWTMLPTEKVVRKMNVYRMRPAHPEFDWFEHNKNKGLMTYDTGERLAEFDDNGRGCWYYRNGRLALEYYDAEEANVQQRFVVYSSGEPDERGRTHPITILATFDYRGNGIVLDHAGKIRLKYNQSEGVVLDRGIGPISHWQWHSLNDPPVLQQVMIDTQMAHKDPNILKLGIPADDKTPRQDNDEMLAIEFDNFIKEKNKKLSQKFKPFQIRMKALKINEHFSLKVLDQATVYLIFRDGSTNLKLNIGMILDHQEIVDTDTAEVGEVLNSLERFPARTDSLAGLQRSVTHAQRYERQQIERERRLRPAGPCASVDQLTAAASPPMRLPFRTVPTTSSSSTGYCSRKPTNNLYYDTRLRS